MTNRRFAVVTLGLALAAAAVAAPFAANAQNNAGGTSPATHVGVVNIRQVLRKSQEFATLQTRFKEKGETLNARKQANALSLRDMQMGMGQVKAGTKEFEDKLKDLQTKSMQLQMDEKMQEFDISREESKSIKNFYDEIQKAVAMTASKRGLDIIMVDNDPELPAEAQGMTPEQLQGVLLQRSIYYSSPSVNVSDDVVTNMDQLFKAPPAPAGR